MAEKLILLLPSVRHGNGSGHLSRSIALARSRPDSFRVFVDSAGELDRERRLDLANFDIPDDCTVSLQQVREYPWRYILLDQRKTPAETLASLKNLVPNVPLASRDEGGALGTDFDYLIQSLPVLKEKEVNLLWEDDLLIPGNHKIAAKKEIQKILVSFGGEDPAGFSLPVTETLIQKSGWKAQRITVVMGAAAAEVKLPEGVICLLSPENLKEHLADYDLLICSFGLTALEAVYAGVPVITVNPSRYHTRLARKLSLPVAGTGSLNGKKLAALINSPEYLNTISCNNIFPAGVSRVHPAELKPHGRVCPVCGSCDGKVVSRLPERTFYCCNECSIIYQQRWIPDTTEYNKDYFFEEYRRQYGKSYLDDYAHIKNIALLRLSEIKRILGPVTTPKLLDIGCAYGPFLSAAHDAGYSCEGVEPAADAAKYTADTLKIPVSATDLQSFIQQNSGRTWDVITLWFVIEHFSDLTEILPALSSMLEPGGVLAFATPNAAGITSRRKTAEFYRRSPSDHYTIWSSSSAGKILRKNDFHTIKYRATGIHKERFSGFARVVWPLTEKAAECFLLGDTFEVYARRAD